MINPNDLSPGCWANCDGIGACRLVVLALRMEGAESYYLLNGIKDEHWEGIRLTPELMDKLGWEMRHDNGLLLSYARPNNFYLSFIRKEGPFRQNDIIAGPAETVIQYLHELQQLYRWETGKHLEVSL